MGLEDGFMSGAQQLAQMQALGLEPLNNAIIAGRMPPSEVEGMHPAGIRIVFEAGHVFDRLRQELGPALKPLTPVFNLAAKPAGPAASPILDPRAKISTGILT